MERTFFEQNLWGDSFYKEHHKEYCFTEAIYLSIIGRLFHGEQNKTNIPELFI